MRVVLSCPAVWTEEQINFLQKSKFNIKFKNSPDRLWSYSKAFKLEVFDEIILFLKENWKVFAYNGSKFGLVILDSDLKNVDYEIVIYNDYIE